MGPSAMADVIAADVSNDAPNSGAISQTKCVFALIDMPHTIPQPRNPKQKKFASPHCGPRRA
jgi:hypothetical protein